MVTRRLFAIGAGAGLLGGALSRVESASAGDAWSGDFGREIARIESGLKARLGVAVLDTATGQRASHRGGERFPMCSTFREPPRRGALPDVQHLQDARVRGRAEAP